MRVDARSLVRAWRLVQAAGVELFGPDAAHELPRVRGWDACGLPTGDIAQTPTVPLLTALRALDLQHAEQPTGTARASLVATLPGARRDVAATRDTVRELLRGAQRELLVVGFAMTDREFRDLLVERAREGVTVTVVGDRESGDATTLARAWPAGATPLVALRDVTPTRDEHRRMHGKVLVADRERALVGSANFTVGGLAGNIEFGVRLEGAIAQEIHRVIDALRSEGWLVAAPT